jgi:glucose/arabinose dehydrogenase
MLSSLFVGARVVGVVLVAAVLTGLPPAAGPAHSSSHLKATPIANGLAFPAGFTFGPNGGIFYGARFSGEIRTFNPNTLRDRLFFRIPNVVTSGEQGLLGVEIHPDYPRPPNVYASVVRMVSGSPRIQIVRINKQSSPAMKVIYNGGASNSNHVGGRILFGPDRMLYFIVGDKGNPSNSQNLGNNAGKLLRMTAGGGVPSDNPFSNRIFAYGIRNSFGFAFDPVTELPIETENGPNCLDETNPIVPGENYGWGPNWTCSVPPPRPAGTNQDGPTPMMPATYYGPPMIAPTGIVFCDNCGLGAASEGHAFFGAWNTGEIRELTLDSTRMSVTSDVVVYDHNQGVLGMERASDGEIYFSTPDKILRLELAP